MSDDARQIALALAPKFSAVLSMLGSGFIIHDILSSHFKITRESNDNAGEGDQSGGNKSSLARNRGRKRKTLKNSGFQRIMLAMSCWDFITSCAWFCSTWPIPKDENSPLDNPSELVYGNIGTIQTCTAQGFFIQLGTNCFAYNAFLSCYYYLTICREWKEEDFQRKIEYAGHALVTSFGLGTAIAGLVMELYNNSRVWCWIAGYPSGCGADDNPCVRGSNFKVLRWAFYYGPLWIYILLVAVFQGSVYFYVRNLETKWNQLVQKSGLTVPPNSTDSVSRSSTRATRLLSSQGACYGAVMAATWFAGTVLRAMQLAGKTVPWIILFWFVVFTPSQGFWNALVYIRPRLIRRSQEKRKQRENGKTSKTRSCEKQSGEHQASRNDDKNSRSDGS